MPVADISRNYKAPIGSPHLAPRVAVVDPSLTVSLPPAVTAGTGMDALTHAIEGYTARCSNPISDALCLYAAELVSSFLVRAFAVGAILAGPHAEGRDELSGVDTHTVYDRVAASSGVHIDGVRERIHTCPDRPRTR